MVRRVRVNSPLREPKQFAARKKTPENEKLDLIHKCISDKIIPHIGSNSEVLLCQGSVWFAIVDHKVASS